MFEFFIAKRYLKSKHRMNFITIISLLSTVGITIGVAALIIVLSVFSGFGSLVQSILINIDPHLRISVVSEKGYEEIKEVGKTLSSYDDIKHYTEFVEGKTILFNNSSFEVLTLKGIVDTSDSDWGLATSIMDGKLDLERENQIDKIVIGLPMALRLSVRVSDTLSVTSANKIEKALFGLSMPTTKRFIISGVFESNNRDYDLAYAFCSLKAAQNIFKLKNRISGYEIRMNNVDDAEGLKEKLEEKFGSTDLKFETWYDLHQELYGMMVIERWAAYILLCLIIAVATFNILGSLTMSVVEKRKDIGILRAMGVTDKSIIRIFMFEGVLIGLLGTLAGALLGLFVCYIQINYNIYPLDPAKYIIDSLPMEIRFV